MRPTSGPRGAAQDAWPIPESVEEPGKQVKRGIMSIKEMWIVVSCDRCGKEIEFELETDTRKWGRAPSHADRLYTYLERMGWEWSAGRLSGRLGEDICKTCSNLPSKEDIADYKAYHTGEGVHTP